MPICKNCGNEVSYPVIYYTEDTVLCGDCFADKIAEKVREETKKSMAPR